VIIANPNTILCAGIGGCTIPTNFRRMFVRGPYDELADSYVVARRFGSEEVRLIADAGINTQGGAPLLLTVPAPCPQAFRVTVYAHELLTARGSFATEQQLMAEGRDISVLKARVTWHLFAEMPRVIELDIGTGFDISVGPTDAVQVDILVPNTDALPSVLPAGRVLSNYNSSIEAVVMCDNGGGGPNFIGRWTQQAYVLTGTAAATRLVAIKPETRFVQILADSTGLPNPRFLIYYPFNPAGSVPYGTIDWNPAGFDTDRVEIPQGASHIEVSAAAANLNGSRITVVQELFR
jgi:hypothetical protein